MRKELEEIKAELIKINAQLDKLTPRKIQAVVRRQYDPWFQKELADSMAERNMSQSDVAAALWGRRISKDGKRRGAINRDRVSVWVRGLGYPSRENLKRVGELFDWV
jgi:hypothetical protein